MAEPTPTDPPLPSDGADLIFEELMVVGSSGPSSHTTGSTSTDSMDRGTFCRVCLVRGQHPTSQCPFVTNQAEFIRTRNANYEQLRADTQQKNAARIGPPSLDSATGVRSGPPPNHPPRGPRRGRPQGPQQPNAQQQQQPPKNA